MFYQRNTIALLVFFAGFCTEIWPAETPLPPYTSSTGETVLSLGDLSNLAKSPDGKVMAGWNNIGIFFWDLQPEPTLRKQYIPVSEVTGIVASDYSVFFLPNDRLLVITTLIQVFDLNTMQRIQSIPLDISSDVPDGINTVELAAVSSDGALIAMQISMPQRLQIWNLTKSIKEKEIFLDESQNEYYTCISFSPDNKKLLLTGRDGKSFLLDVATLHFILTFQDGYGHYFHSCFSPDGRYAAAGTADGYLIKWDATTGERKFEVYNHPGCISNVQFTSDGKSILTSHENWYLALYGNGDYAQETEFYAYEDPVIILCNAETGKESTRLSSSIRDSSSMFLAGNNAYGIDINNLITCWDLQSGDVLRQIGDEFFSPSDIAVSQDNMQFAAIARPSRIDLFDRKTLKKIRFIENGAKCDQIQYSPNGQWLLSVNLDGIVTIWDAQTGNLKQRIEVLPKRELSDNPEDAVFSPYFICSVQFLPDNQTFLVLSYFRGQYAEPSYSELTVYSIESGIVKTVYPGKKKQYTIYSTCVSPDGEIVVLKKDKLETWDSLFEEMISYTSPPLTQSGDAQTGGTMAFTDDGSILYGTDMSKHFEMNWETGKFVHIIPNTTNWIRVTDTWMAQDIILMYEAHNKQSAEEIICQIINWKTGKQLATIPGAYLAKLTQDKLHLICTGNLQLQVLDTNRLLNGSSGIDDAMLY